MTSELKKEVRRFFEFLDAVEVSDSGVEFHPIQVSCCRAMKMAPLAACLTRMKELAQHD